MDLTAGRDRLEAEAGRQQESHQQSCSDMQTSMSGDASSDAANAMQNSKDGKLMLHRSMACAVGRAHQGRLVLLVKGSCKCHAPLLSELSDRQTLSP